MKIPSKIKIGGHKYQVIFPYVFTERTDRGGDCDFQRNVIRIADSVGTMKCADSTIMVTLIHEVLHAIDNTSGHAIFSGEYGENEIEGLSEGIYQVLVDNNFLKGD